MKSERQEYQHLEASEGKKGGQKRPVWEKTELRETMTQEFQEAESNQ